MTTKQKMDQLTYAVQHNPNCPAPFLVRLVGHNRGVIDYLPYTKTKDALGSGQTLIQAGKRAIAALEAQKEKAGMRLKII